MPQDVFFYIFSIFLPFYCWEIITQTYVVTITIIPMFYYSIQCPLSPTLFKFSGSKANSLVILDVYAASPLKAYSFQLVKMNTFLSTSWRKRKVSCCKSNRWRYHFLENCGTMFCERWVSFSAFTSLLGVMPVLVARPISIIIYGSYWF